jgi:ribonucleoside-diphosphate reductase beta chain
MSQLDRFLLVFKRPELARFYQKQQAALWTAQEIDLSRDPADYEKLNTHEQNFLDNVLAFFAAADGIVVENLMSNFFSNCDWPEARAFWGVQAYIETVHAETYALLLTSLVKDTTKLDKLLHAAETIPSVAKKANWSLNWMSSQDTTFIEKLVAFAVVEGIMFSSSFACIYWFKKKGLLPGVTLSNEFISRDEGLHADFACALYRELKQPLSDERVKEIIKQGVEIEKEFVQDSLKVELLGMNAKVMREYVEVVANRLCSELQIQPLWPNAQCHLEFMDLLNLQSKTNFFESRSSVYQMAYTGENSASQSFTISEDF